MFSRCFAARAAAVVGSCLLLTSSASAQAPVPAHSLLGLLNDLAAKVNSVASGGVPSALNLNNSGIAALVGLEVSSAPLGTSTGGFTFRFDRALGIVERSTQSFGPTFGQRSPTTGKGKVSVGFNTLHAHYDSLEGLDLANGDYRPVKNVRTVAGVPLPVFYSSIRADFTSDILAGFVSYGVTNDLDIGVAVPWVRVSLAADAGLFGPADEDLTPGGHLLVIPNTNASGVGDIAIFGKYHVWRQGEGGLAAEAELRLPSGDTNSLRGLGFTRTLVSAIWSMGGRVSPHANVGYEYWSDSVLLPDDVFLKDQINYAFGLEFAAHPRATAIVDIVGRRLLHGGQVTYRNQALGPGIVGDVLETLPQGFNVISFAPGIKWNVAGNVLLTGNVLLSITNNGLRAKVTPVVGLEWAF